MQHYIVTLGVQFLTGLGGVDRWSTNRKLAMPLDQEQAEQICSRINAQQLGNTKAKVKATRPGRAMGRAES